MIRCYDDIFANEIDNWLEIIVRIRQLRQEREWSINETCNHLEVQNTTYLKYEPNDERDNAPNGKQIRRRSIMLPRIAALYEINLNWLINGCGSPNDPPTPEWMATARVNEVGAGIRKNDFRSAVDDGTYDGEMMEFVQAVDHYKRVNNLRFLTLTQTFQVIQDLGYRKVAESIIGVNHRQKKGVASITTQ